MNKKSRKNVRRKNYTRARNRRQPEPTTNMFTLKIFIAFVILLSTLYIKKYDVKVGGFSVDTIYEVLYYNEDFNELSNKVFKMNGGSALGNLFGVNDGEGQ
ncbi:hypothetical protein HZI73_14585 [Vallitalea pronyensis]|uniref:Uncharacterized protein n=1 Tax=Vallitalea pronyensis TaxID=1348613 RepID=A0A8J8MKK2_9FIRM|nr:hypothetical protein [Vallitalea pronyensis]QUI23435.1 hypothetical protein HZI73_14585 [Vallitalea pronyensis]